jgi:hypothetical protein
MNNPSDILFITDSIILPELDLIKREIYDQGLGALIKVDFFNAFEMLSVTRFSFVIINAHDKKIEAFDFCLKLRSALGVEPRVFVFMPDATLNEASKFGKINAEIIDFASLEVLIDALKIQESAAQSTKKIHSIISVNGGLGASTLAVLIAFALQHFKKTSLILESTNKFTIRDLLGIHAGKPFLTRDRALEHKQILDQKWFSGFLQTSLHHPYVKYLDLFTDCHEKISYLEKTASYCDSLNAQIQEIGIEDLKSFQLSLITDSLKLIAKDLKGDSGILVDELVKYFYSLDHEVIADLGFDYQTSLNRQFLALSKNIILLFSDEPGTKSIVLDLKNYLQKKYSANIIGVFVSEIENYNFYQNITPDEWCNTIGFHPLILPRQEDLVSSFIFDNECIPKDSKIFYFLKSLLCEMGNFSGDFKFQKNGAFKFLKYV